jgi:uncharacterized protein
VWNHWLNQALTSPSLPSVRVTLTVTGMSPACLMCRPRARRATCPVGTRRVPVHPSSVEHMSCISAGWQFTDYAPAYAGIQAPEGDGEVGGLSLGQNVEPGGPLVLLYSDDLDATVAAVKDAGGTIAEEPYAFPGGRRFTFFDPSGNRFGVWSTT